MTIHYRTALTAVGPDAADLLDGGILILFADGAPPELAEVSVLHRVAEGPSPDAPRVGATLTIGGVAAELTAIGALAWAKIADMGHVVINFDGAVQGGRPGEISVAAVDPAALAAAVRPGATLTIAG